MIRVNTGEGGRAYILGIAQQASANLRGKAMSYEMTVRFWRDYGDDTGVIGKASPSPKDFAIQLAKEIQAAYDELGIAGSFQVETVIIEGKTHYIDGAKP